MNALTATSHTVCRTDDIGVGQMKAFALAGQKIVVYHLSDGFFATQATNGMGRIVDIYQTSGTALTGAKYNSMSIIGTAAAGALYSAGSTAAHKQFLDRAWRFLLDASYTPDPTYRAGPTAAYTYYNATVGLLTALTLSGNFNSF